MWTGLYAARRCLARALANRCAMATTYEQMKSPRQSEEMRAQGLFSFPTTAYLFSPPGALAAPPAVSKVPKFRHRLHRSFERLPFFSDLVKHQSSCYMRGSIMIMSCVRYRT